MKPYRYEVIIKAAEGQNVATAIENLIDAQTSAQTAFEIVTAFLQGEEFAETVLGAISDRLEKLDRPEITLELDKHINPIIIALNEIRAGIIVLMDLKKGSVKGVLDAFQLAQKTLQEGKIEDIMEGLYKEFLRDFKDTTDESIENLVDLLNIQIPTSGDVDVSRVSHFFEDESGVHTLSEKVTQRSIGNLDKLMEGFKPKFLFTVISAFQKLMATKGEDAPKTPADIFNDILEGSKAYEKITKAITERSRLRKEREKFDIEHEALGRQGLLSTEFSRKGQFDKPMANIDAIIGNTDALKKDFEKGLRDRIEKFDIDILKDENVISILMESVGDMFTKTSEIVIDKLKLGKTPEGKFPPAPSFGREFQWQKSSLEWLGEEQIKKLLDKLDELGDPLKFEAVQKIIDDVMKKSQIEAIQTGEKPITVLGDIMKQNFEEAGSPITKLLTEVIMEILKSGASTLLAEARYVFENVLAGKNAEIFFEKLHESFANFALSVEKFPDYMTQQNQRNTELMVGEGSESDFDIEEYFEEAILNKRDLGTLLDGIEEILRAVDGSRESVIEDLETAIGLLRKMSGSDESTLDYLYDIESAATSSHLKGGRRGS